MSRKEREEAEKQFKSIGKYKMPKDYRVSGYPAFSQPQKTKEYRSILIKAYEDEIDANPMYLKAAELAKSLNLSLAERRLRQIADDELEHKKSVKAMLEGIGEKLI